VSRRRTIALGAGALAGAALIALALRGPAQLVETGEVRVAPFVLSFQEEGKTRLKHRYLVTAPVPARSAHHARAGRRGEGRPGRRRARARDLRAARPG
jgi:hypothetical protein